MNIINNAYILVLLLCPCFLACKPLPRITCQRQSDEGHFERWNRAQRRLLLPDATDGQGIPYFYKETGNKEDRNTWTKISSRRAGIDSILEFSYTDGHKYWLYDVNYSAWLLDEEHKIIPFERLGGTYGNK